jgi:hypothetical protein
MLGRDPDLISGTNMSRHSATRRPAVAANASGPCSLILSKEIGGPACHRCRVTASRRSRDGRRYPIRVRVPIQKKRCRSRLKKCQKSSYIETGDTVEYC